MHSKASPFVGIGDVGFTIVSDLVKPFFDPPGIAFSIVVRRFETAEAYDGHCKSNIVMKALSIPSVRVRSEIAIALK